MPVYIPINRGTRIQGMSESRAPVISLLLHALQPGQLYSAYETEGVSNYQIH